MKKFLTIIVIMLLCSITCYSQVFERTINKSFIADKEYTINIESRISDVTIDEWDKSEIYFDILIKSNDKNVNDRISIEFKELDKIIYAKTILNDFNCNNCDFSFSYNIKVPKGISYKIRNALGKTYLNSDIEGDLDINVAYSDLVLKNINGKAFVRIKSKSCNIGNVKGDIKVRITEGTLNIKELQGNNKIDIKKSGNITINSIINGSNEIDIINGKLIIQDVKPEFKELKINAEYAPINIKFDEKTAYDLNVTYDDITKVSINPDKEIKFTESGEVKKVTGYVGKPSKSEVTIDSKFGKIELSN